MLHDLEFFSNIKNQSLSMAGVFEPLTFQIFVSTFQMAFNKPLKFTFKNSSKTFAALSGENIENLGTFAKVKLALMTRFKTLEPYKPIEKSLFNYIKLSPQGMRFLYKIIDEIWHWAGDQSTDHNFYTKRTLLAGVYISAFKTWIQDDSSNLNLTSEKIDSHFERIRKIPQIKNDIKTF